MSYSLVPYLVDLDRLRQVVGSRDEALLSAVIAQDPESFGEEAADEDEISLGTALRHLIMGETPKQGSAHQYGYALEQLCRHLGEPIGERDLWESIRWQVLEATGADELMKQTGSPVPLPRIDSFPAIGHLEAKKIAALLGKLGSGTLKTAAPSGRKPRRTFASWLLDLLLSRFIRREPMSAEDVAECLAEFEGWLREAAAKQKSLVFFYY